MNLAVLYVAVPKAETMGHMGRLFLLQYKKIPTVKYLGTSIIWINDVCYLYSA